jgi:beta-carotene ketolase (CrtO type)
LNPLTIMSNDSMLDLTRIISNGDNSNKHLIKFLVLSVPYEIKNADSEISLKTEWDNFKDIYADQIIETINQGYIPNLKSSVLKKTIYSPVDYEKKPINSIKGTLTSGAILPYQSGWMRPIPQLGSYKIPSIPNAYLCGSGSHPGLGVSMAPGRNAAQVILRDLGIDLRNIFTIS